MANLQGGNQNPTSSNPLISAGSNQMQSYDMQNK